LDDRASSGLSLEVSRETQTPVALLPFFRLFCFVALSGPTFSARRLIIVAFFLASLFREAGRYPCGSSCFFRLSPLTGFDSRAPGPSFGGFIRSAPCDFFLLRRRRFQSSLLPLLFLFFFFSDVDWRFSPLALDLEPDRFNSFRGRFGTGVLSAIKYFPLPLTCVPTGHMVLYEPSGI